MAYEGKDNDALLDGLSPETKEKLAKARASQLAAQAEEQLATAENIRLATQMATIDFHAKQRSEKDELAKNRHHKVYIFDEVVREGSVSTCMEQLTKWARTDPGCAMEIVFNSPGGSIIDGMALFDFIRMLRAQGHNITTSALGMAASMAGILLQAGDKRVMGKEAWLLIHEASFMALGKTGEVEDTFEWIKRIQDRILDIFSERSKMSRSQIKKRWTRKDWWISSDEALEFGFVDEVR